MKTILLYNYVIGGGSGGGGKGEGVARAKRATSHRLGQK